MPVEVALPVSYSRSSYSNMPTLPLGTSKRRTSETSTYSSGSLASRRQIRASLLERTASLTSPSNSNGYTSTYSSSKYTSYQSSYRSLPSGPGPLDTSGKRIDSVYLENLRRGRFDVMPASSSSRSSSLPPPSRLLTRRESVSEICSQIKRDRDILLRGGRETTSPYRETYREGSVKRELDSFQREGSMKRDMDSFRRGRSVEPISYKDSYRKERESSISRFSNLSSSSLSSTLGSSRWSQSITDLTSDLDNMKSGDYNANSRYLDTLNSSIHDPYGTLPRRSRFRTESVEREERSRSRISESPIRGSRVSESPSRSRVSVSPTRTRIIESPSRYRLSESPSKTRLSDSATRALNNDEAAKIRLSEISARTVGNDSSTKMRSSDSSSRTTLSKDSSNKSRLNDNSTRTLNDSSTKARSSDSSSRTNSNDSSVKARLSDSSSRSTTNDSSVKARLSDSSSWTTNNDVSAKTRLSDSSSRTTSNDSSTKARLSDTSSRTTSSDSSAKSRLSDSSSRTVTNDISTKPPRLSDSSTRNLSNDSSAKTRLNQSSTWNLSNDSSAKPRLSESSKIASSDISVKPPLSESSARTLSNDSSVKHLSESSRTISNDSKPRLSVSSRTTSNDNSAKPRSSEPSTKTVSVDSLDKHRSNESSVNTVSNDSSAKTRLSDNSARTVSNDISTKSRSSESSVKTVCNDIAAKPGLSESSSRSINNDSSVKTCVNDSSSKTQISDNSSRPPRISDISTRTNINESPLRPRISDSAARPPRVSESPVRRVIETPLRANVSESSITSKYDINHNPTTIVTSPTTSLPKPPLSDYGSLTSSTPRRDRYSSYSSASDDGYDSRSRRSSLISNGKPEPATTLSSRNEYNTIKSSASSKDSNGIIGLRNLGNTCFMNSVIQCLSNTQPVLDYCLKDSYISDLNTSHSSMKGALTKAFSGLIQSLWKDSTSSCVSPHTFKQQIQKFAPRFMGYSQQDAQEFLRYLLQGLHEDVNRVTGKPKPIPGDIDENLSDSQKATEAWKRYLHLDDSKIVDLFVGQLKSTLKCTTCGHSSVTFDPFWDLSLPIPKSYGSVTLQECLNLFTKEEVLDGDEKPTCSRCNKREKCMKSLTIQRFPRTLVIHLKRFSQERYRAKLTTLVDFPVNNLDLSKYAADKRGVQKATYNLYAAANHSGTTYGGHYTAYCKHPKTGEWYDFNDTTVTPVATVSDIIGPEAYLLFYEMIGTSSRL